MANTPVIRKLREMKLGALVLEASSATKVDCITSPSPDQYASIEFSGPKITNAEIDETNTVDPHAITMTIEDGQGVSHSFLFNAFVEFPEVDGWVPVFDRS